MISFEGYSLTLLITMFVVATIVIAVTGTKLAYVAEKIARDTGIGQALIGAVLIGITTSLSGTITSFYTAFQGAADLAISNSIGGIAAQITFLALADMTYRKANLEHAGASLENLAQGVLLIGLLTLPILAYVTPPVSFYSVHPVSVLLIAGYLGGLHIARRIKEDPMWQAHKTPQTQKEDQGHPESDKALRLAFVQFFALMIIMGAAGLAVANTALEIIDRTGMSQTLMGTLFTSVSTSLPELVTALAAVRRGAVNLAIGNIMGGNAFDVLFLAGSDMFFRKGSIYHAITHQNLMVISVAILMTSILLLGLLRREKKGPGGIGFESALILLVYGAMAVYLAGG